MHKITWILCLVTLLSPACFDSAEMDDDDRPKKGDRKTELPPGTLKAMPCGADAFAGQKPNALAGIPQF